MNLPLLKSISLTNKFKALFEFSKKKILEKKRVSWTKFDPVLKGYVLFEHDNTRRHMIMSWSLTAFSVYSLFRLGYLWDDSTNMDFLFTILVCFACYSYQKRLSQTLKKITLDQKGENLQILSYSRFGENQLSLDAPIWIMGGIYKQAPSNRAYIKVRGMNNLQQKKYYFHQKYIIDKEIFEVVVQGKSIKVVK